MLKHCAMSVRWILPLPVVALAACMSGDDDGRFVARGAVPIAAELLGEEVRLSYPDGQVCTVRPDPGTVRGEEWEAASTSCPRVSFLNVRYRFENHVMEMPDGTSLSTLRVEDTYSFGAELSTPGRAADARVIEVVFDTGEGGAGFVAVPGGCCVWPPAQ